MNHLVTHEDFSKSGTVNDAQRFEGAIRRFDEENSRDPNKITFNGTEYPREVIYAQWLTEWVAKLAPGASQELLLAARCQHLCRWMIPRDSYPMTRPGYLKWRQDLKKFHAKRAGEILAEYGFPPEVIKRVQELNLKKNVSTDPECQTLEDALCMVFLEHQLAELAEKTSEEKVINALQKSWKKMSPAARSRASELPLGPKEKALLESALV